MPASKLTAFNHARKILNFLEKRSADLKSLLILTHDYPDPDALATAYALYYIMQKKFNVRSRIVYGGSVGRGENKSMVSLLKIPAHELKASDLKRKHIATIDTQPSFENNSYPKGKTAFLVMDQHPSVGKVDAECSVVDTECGATSVIAAQMLLQSGLEIPKKLATAVTYGILSDTLHLHRARRQDIIQTYFDILPLCDMRILTKIQNPSRPKNFFKTVKRTLDRSKVLNRFVYAHLGSVDHPDLVSEMTDFLLTYRGSTRAVCTGRYSGKLYVSLRTTRDEDNAPKILRSCFEDRLQAGGHGNIAGGSFEVHEDLEDESWDRIEESLIQKLRRKFKIPTKTESSTPFS